MKTYIEMLEDLKWSLEGRQLLFYYGVKLSIVFSSKGFLFESNRKVQNLKL